MRCKCCDKMLPAVRQTKSYMKQISNTKVRKVYSNEEEDLCNVCLAKSNPDYDYSSDTDTLDELGIDFTFN